MKKTKKSEKMKFRDRFWPALFLKKKIFFFQKKRQKKRVFLARFLTIFDHFFSIFWKMLILKFRDRFSIGNFFKIFKLSKSKNRPKKTCFLHFFDPYTWPILNDFGQKRGHKKSLFLTLFFPLFSKSPKYAHFWPWNKTQLKYLAKKGVPKSAKKW